MSSFIATRLPSLLAFFVLAFFLHRLALRKGLYRLKQDRKITEVSLKQVIGSFALYFSLFFLLPVLLFAYFPFKGQVSSLGAFSFAELVSVASCFFFSTCFPLYAVKLH